MERVLDALDAHARSQGDKVVFDDLTGAITYAGLAQRVWGLAKRLAPGSSIGLYGSNGIDWIVADLAIAAAGATSVPLPAFFSAEQIRYVIADAGVTSIIAAPGNWVKDVAADLPILDVAAGSGTRRTGGAGEKIIYTSGSTGRPKGVRLGSRQINAVVVALAQASGAGPNDRHLSLLPYPMLLETICGIYLPILVGASAGIVATPAAAGDPIPPIAALSAGLTRFAPTTTVLVPDLLAAWVKIVRSERAPRPAGLRFVAVGGAPVAADLADAAWACGIPVHEGYGLSECASVVCLNRAGRRKSGTVGEPLEGIALAIEAGEIVVSSPTVMEGYLGQPGPCGHWRTGDLGSIDPDGFVRVYGRKDNLIVLTNGRNLSPEWAEAAFLATPGIERAIVLGHNRPFPTAILWPSASERRRLSCLTRAGKRALLAVACATLPSYARPEAILIAETPANDPRLFTANGRPRRQAIAETFEAAITAIYDQAQDKDSG